MDNLGFELQEEEPPRGVSTKQEFQKVPGKAPGGSLLRFFLLCLLASILSTALGVLLLALLWNKPGEFQGEQRPTKIPELGKVEPKFQFLHRLSRAKVHKYPGGEIQWARFRRDPREYETPEAEEFGQSLNFHSSQITVGTLRIWSQGLRAPHWHFNANEHGYVVKGEAWIGVLGPDGATTVTYNVSRGQVVFFPRNAVHWVKNVGPSELLLLLFFSTHNELLTLDVDDAFYGTPEDVAARALKLLLLLFFSTHHELLTLDVNDAFYGTPEDVAARALKPQGGVEFIRTFQKPQEDQAINLPKNLEQLIHNSSYPQSPDSQVWKFFYDLPASQEFPFPGGVFQWARFRKNGTGLTENEKIFSQSLHQHENTLTLATLRIFSNNLGVPHFHFNANEVGVVLSGCGQVGLILPDGNLEFPVGIGDVVFFPVGSQHFVQSFCQEDLLLLLAYSTGNQLETLRMNQYFHSTADHILAQLFNKDQLEFQKIPKRS